MTNKRPSHSYIFLSLDFSLGLPVRVERFRLGQEPLIRSSGGMSIPLVMRHSRW